jgi:hypothetical protein
MPENRYPKTMLLLLAAVILGSGSAGAATDYSAMSTEEMAARRDAMQQATSEEHQAFQEEWQQRLKRMSPEERQQHMGRPESAPEPEQRKERLKEKTYKQMPSPQNRGMERREELGLGGQPGRPEQTPAGPGNNRGQGQGKGR